MSLQHHTFFVLVPKTPPEICLQPKQGPQEKWTKHSKVLMSLWGVVNLPYPYQEPMYSDQTLWENFSNALVHYKQLPLGHFRHRIREVFHPFLQSFLAYTTSHQPVLLFWEKNEATLATTHENSNSATNTCKLSKLGCDFRCQSYTFFRKFWMI